MEILQTNKLASLTQCLLVVITLKELLNKSVRTLNKWSLNVTFNAKMKRITLLQKWKPLKTTVYPILNLLNKIYFSTDRLQLRLQSMMTFWITNQEFIDMSLEIRLEAMQSNLLGGVLITGLRSTVGMKLGVKKVCSE